MNKNVIYIAVFAVLCVLAGALVGAGITLKACSLWPCPGRAGFSDRAESFMQHGPFGPGKDHFMRHGPWHAGRNNKEGLLNMMSEKLDLTKEQQAKVKGILDNVRSEIDEVGKNVRSSIVNIKDKGDKKIMDILTPEQQQKFKAMLQEFKEKFNSRRDRKTLGMSKRCALPPPPEEDLPPVQND